MKNQNAQVFGVAGRWSKELHFNINETRTPVIINQIQGGQLSTVNYKDEIKGRKREQMWVFLLLLVVLTLVLINDMLTYGDWESVKTTKRMQVVVYYETLCPDSKHFIIKQLKPAYEKLHEVMDIAFVPYGKAKKEIKGIYITHTCQHGPVECAGNTVHACVVDAVTDQRKQLDIVSCMIEHNEKPSIVGQKCVEKYGESWDKVNECIDSPKAATLLQHMGVKTNNLNPKVSFIPTIQIDGDLSEQSHILQNLHKVMCQRFKEPKPPSC